MTSTTSATLTSLGLGSGLDAESIVTKLVALERQPITKLQTEASTIQSKISAFGKIQSAVSTLRDAAAKLTTPDLWASTTATSSDETIAKVTTSSGAATGNYAVVVSSLAAAQTTVTNTAVSSSTATVGSGTLTIDTGSWAADNTFTQKSGTSSVSISIADTDTLEGIRDKINNSGAAVKASIVKDASTGAAKLVMNSTATGASNGFRIQADASSTSGVAALAFDPANSTTGTTRTQSATNASATINGVAVSSETNTISGALTGIDIKVNKVSSTAVSVNVEQDNTTITAAIQAFATAYSSLYSTIKSNTKYDDSTKTAATLQGDSTAVGMGNRLRTLLGATSSASSVFTSLSSLGLEVQSGGSLTVNSTKLTSALSNLAEVKKAFSAADTSGGGADGFATRFRSLADEFLGTEGPLTSRTTGLNTLVKNNSKRQDELDARATLYEKRLRAQYSALDTKMSQISSTSNYVTQMINSLNATNKSSS